MLLSYLMRAPNEEHVKWVLGGVYLLSKQCRLLPSYTVDNQNRCKKYYECTMTGRANDPKCLARAQK